MPQATRPQTDPVISPRPQKTTPISALASASESAFRARRGLFERTARYVTEATRLSGRNTEAPIQSGKWNKTSGPYCLVVRREETLAAPITAHSRAMQSQEQRPSCEFSTKRSFSSLLQQREHILMVTCELRANHCQRGSYAKTGQCPDCRPSKHNCDDSCVYFTSIRRMSEALHHAAHSGQANQWVGE